MSVGLLLAGGLVALLVLTAGSFGARSDPLMARRGLRLLLAGEILVFAYGTAGLYFLDEEFRDSATLIDAARSAVRLLLLLPANAITPVDPDGRWFVDSVRLAGLGVVVVALILIVASVLATAADASDRRLVERLIDSWATNSLASFHLLEGTSWFISDDRRAFIGYRLVGITAVALAEPIGEPQSRINVVAEFLDLCELNGWVPAFHQLSSRGDEMFAEAGLKCLKIGEEAIVPVQTWSEDAPGYKQLRSALRRVERSGCELVELPRPIDEATMRELREVSDAWLSQGGHRERTFTVGQFDPDYLRQTTVLVLRQRDSHRIEAFVNVLPSYSSSVGNFDLMRRRPDAPNGVMEYLVVALIHRFRAEGRTGMTLGLAPLANIDGEGIPDRALRLLYDRGTKVFNYQGLHHFKEKWNPVWEARYLAYRSDTELPRIAGALARVGEIPDPAWGPSEGVGVRASLPRHTLDRPGRVLDHGRDSARPVVPPRARATPRAVVPRPPAPAALASADCRADPDSSRLPVGEHRAAVSVAAVRRVAVGEPSVDRHLLPVRLGVVTPDVRMHGRVRSDGQPRCPSDLDRARQRVVGWRVGARDGGCPLAH